MNDDIINLEKYVCKCGKEFTNVYSFSGHKSHCKIINPKAKSNRFKDGIPWNKGLTKYNNEIIYTRGKKLSERYKSGELVGWFKGKHHTAEAKRKISEKMTINNRGGRCKWYNYNGQKLQGTYELNFAKKLDEYNINWLKIKTNSMTLNWVDDNNKNHKYTPDFYLKDYDLYIEIKGYWWGNDKRKMELVKIQNNIHNIIIIEKELYTQIINNNINIKEYIEEFLMTLA